FDGSCRRARYFFSLDGCAASGHLLRRAPGVADAVGGPRRDLPVHRKARARRLLHQRPRPDPLFARGSDAAAPHPQAARAQGAAASGRGGRPPWRRSPGAGASSRDPHTPKTGRLSMAKTQKSKTVAKKPASKAPKAAKTGPKTAKKAA